MTCCGRSPSPVAVTLLARLLASGANLPPSPRVARGGAGWRWHVPGADPPLGSSCPASSLLGSAGPLRLIEADGRLHVHGSEPCPW